MRLIWSLSSIAGDTTTAMNETYMDMGSKCYNKTDNTQNSKQTLPKDCVPDIEVFCFKLIRYEYKMTT